MYVDHPVGAISNEPDDRRRHSRSRNCRSRAGRGRQFRLGRRRGGRCNRRGPRHIGLRHKSCGRGGRRRAHLGGTERAAAQKGDPDRDADNNSSRHKRLHLSARPLPEIVRDPDQRGERKPPQTNSLGRRPRRPWAQRTSTTRGCAPRAKARVKLRNRQDYARPRRHRDPSD